MSGERMKLPGAKRLGTPEVRFWSRVEKTEGCWLWRGTTNLFGYGVIEIDGRTRRAHRISWEWAHGPIPSGLVVLHSCDVPACVNPAHLSLGTHADNVADKCAKGRCPRGENAGPAKLTDAQAQEIREARARGESCASVAARFGVGLPCVSDIANNRRRVDPSKPTAPRRPNRRTAQRQVVTS